VRLLKIVLSIFFIILSPSLYAWDSNGHKLVAEIAYENLTPNAKKTVLQLLQTPGPWYSHSLSFSNSAAWADWIRPNTSQYDTWHYINLPYCGDNVCLNDAIVSPNVVTAITLDTAILHNKGASAEEQGQALRFYLHWLGDIHQPMHTISYYSAGYPQGDAGGNRYLLQDSLYPNLHAFWDGGCGLWPQNKNLNKKQIRALAKQWQALYPSQEFRIALADKNPLNWVKDSHTLAIEYAYEAVPQHYLSLKAQRNAQIVCQKQIVLAGYRLAQNLNAWYAIS
jgi:S1/P1 Nuclease